MRIGLIIMAVFFGLFLLFGGLIFMTGVSFNNNCVGQEADIRAQYKSNQSNYDNGWKKVKEVAQVPDMYANDMKKVYDGAIQGRYGKNGSKAMFQWIQEKNPDIDSSIYKQIQQVIESMRNDFDQNQKQLLDKKRIYEQTTKEFPAVLFAHFLGFPSKDISDMDIVTSSETEDAFKTKKAEEIKLR